jgi:hypothetical protein
MNKSLSLLVGCVLLFGFGCKSTYYAAWEKLGYEKRDILVDRVEDARDEQNGAKQQFKTTLERFQELTNFSGGELEAKYKKLKSDYERCESRAAAVSDRIKAVESVGNDLFTEWRAEINQMESADLKARSEKLMNDTRVRYDQLIASMKNSEAKMKPVLSAFKDQVLFLKANLNAQAIANLKETAASIETDVQGLIRDMEASINEANAFIESMNKK